MPLFTGSAVQFLSAVVMSAPDVTGERFLAKLIGSAIASDSSSSVYELAVRRARVVKVQTARGMGRHGPETVMI